MHEIVRGEAVRGIAKALCISTVQRRFLSGRLGNRVLEVAVGDDDAGQDLREKRQRLAVPGVVRTEQRVGALRQDVFPIIPFT